MSQDTLGDGAAAGGPHRSEAAEPASTDAGDGEVEKGFLRSGEEIYKHGYRWFKNPSDEDDGEIK